MMSANLRRGLLLSFVWWMLTEGRADSWDVGAVSVIAALAASLYLSPPQRGRFLWHQLPAFAGFFLVHSVCGGIQVAARALRPRMNLAPGWIDVPLTLPDGLPRVLLVNTLNLMPGTVSTNIKGDALRLHVLDMRLPVAGAVRKVETHIGRLLGLEP